MAQYFVVFEIKASFYSEIEVEDVGMYYSHDTGQFRMELKGEVTDYYSDELFIDDAIGFTDDTVMTLAIKKALKTGANLVETMVEIGREYPFAGYSVRFFFHI
jgi:hypothetical protein